MFEVAPQATRTDHRFIAAPHSLSQLEGSMTHMAIRHDAIKQQFAELHESFDSHGPLRVAVDALIPDRLGASVATPTAVNNHAGGSAIHNGALFAVGSRKASQLHALACRQRPKR